MNFFAQIPLAGLEKTAGFQIFYCLKIKKFPLVTWKEQTICLEKLQAVVITL